MNCIKCGSFAINEGNYDRVRGVDSNLCDVHYWMKRATRITELEAQLEAAKKSNPWIPVSERLPENNTRVFVVNKFGQRDMADVYEGAFENCWDIDDADETITHWMPLPAAPAIQAEGKA